MGSGVDAPPHVHCPVTVAVGDGRRGMVKFLAPEGIRQASRFPQGRLERYSLLAEILLRCSFNCTFFQLFLQPLQRLLL